MEAAHANNYLRIIEQDREYDDEDQEYDEDEEHDYEEYSDEDYN